jgi:hypothetical protein
MPRASWNVTSIQPKRQLQILQEAAAGELRQPLVRDGHAVGRGTGGESGDQLGHGLRLRDDLYLDLDVRVLLHEAAGKILLEGLTG